MCSSVSRAQQRPRFDEQASVEGRCHRFPVGSRGLKLHDVYRFPHWIRQTQYKMYCVVTQDVPSHSACKSKNPKCISCQAKNPICIVRQSRKCKMYCLIKRKIQDVSGASKKTKMYGKIKQSNPTCPFWSSNKLQDV